MLHSKFKFFFIGIVQLPLLLADSLSCAEYSNGFVHAYHPLRHCQRSNKTVIGSFNVKTVDKCADLAAKRKAMAFNFAPLDRGNENLFEKIKGLQNLRVKSTILSTITRYPVPNLSNPMIFTSLEIVRKNWRFSFFNKKLE